MGKFDGILLATDLDGTLLTDEKTISCQNKEAIEYFISEGGYFTITTGRSQLGIQLVLEQIMPNAPIVLYNGSAVYDIKKDKILWETFLDENAKNVFKMIEEEFPFSAIEVWGLNDIFVTRTNMRLEEQLAFEGIAGNYLHFSEISEPLRKALFIQEEDEIEQVRNKLLSSSYSNSYNFMQSSPHYYEILPKDASKGNGLLKIAEILGISPQKTVGVGDNENDISLITKAGIGVAVANAVPSLLDVADFITTDNNSHAIAAVIYAIENKSITF